LIKLANSAKSKTCHNEFTSDEESDNWDEENENEDSFLENAGNEFLEDENSSEGEES